MKLPLRTDVKAGETPAFVAALFGKFATDPHAREIMSNVATWPKSKSQLTDRLGNFAHILRWKARGRGKKRETIIEARNHPAVDWLLEIIIPALCDRNPQPFQLFADAIKANKSNAFPAKQIALTTLQTAYELAQVPMPFNAVGEPAVNDIGEVVELKTTVPEVIRVPVTESELRRKVEKRLGWNEGDQNPGSFTRLLVRLRITCHKVPNSGGRGRTASQVLQSRTSRQKPN